MWSCLLYTGHVTHRFERLINLFQTISILTQYPLYSNEAHLRHCHLNRYFFSQVSKASNLLRPLPHIYANAHHFIIV